MSAVLERTITLTDMVAYAGATWDWHPLHFDAEFLAERGLDRPVVDGQVLGALAAESILDHLGAGAFITNLSIKYRAMVFAGDTVRVECDAGSAGEDQGSFTFRVTVGPSLVADGSASVRRG